MIQDMGVLQLLHQDNIDRVYHMMDDNINEIANAISISHEIVKNILHYELDMMKVSVQWVPIFLRPNQECTRLITPVENLTLIETDPVGFLERLLTKNECRFHCFEPATKIQSMLWKPLISTASKKSRLFHLQGR